MKRPAGGGARPPEASFADLAAIEADIVACEACPRLRAHCRRVAFEKVRRYRDQEYWGRPVPAFGDPRARLLVVGLAPAAHGGNRTGRVFTGDASGDWLYAALHRYGFADRPESVARGDGLVLVDAWVTAAARCAPPANRPSPAELLRCRPYLEAEIALLSRVEVVVTLGAIAHDAWLRASGWWKKLPPPERPRFEHGGETRLEDGTLLIASYHPSRQNTNTGRLTRPMWESVFARARAALSDAVAIRRPASTRPKGGSRRTAASRPKKDVRLRRAGRRHPVE
jgi:uracil-DNA glycosylase